jgi:GNAT superfamily N-acetyltransferase
MIRPLDPIVDAEVILDLYVSVADYIDLESGRLPSKVLLTEFFADAPPNGDLASSLKMGLFEEARLVGVADLAFGYPEPRDAYLGLMMVARDARGRGLGSAFLRELETVARVRGAKRMLLAVLEANPRGRAFWEREGFRNPKQYPPAQLGERIHVRIRLEKPL